MTRTAIKKLHRTTQTREKILSLQNEKSVWYVKNMGYADATNCVHHDYKWHVQMWDDSVVIIFEHID